MDPCEKSLTPFNTPKLPKEQVEFCLDQLWEGMDIRGDKLLQFLGTIEEQMKTKDRFIKP